MKQTKINKKKIIIPVVVIVLVAAAACTFFFMRNKEPDNNQPSETLPSEYIAQGEMLAGSEGGIKVSPLFSYTGEYVEDNSNENVENVIAVKLINSSEKDYEYVEFTVKTDSGEHKFTASTVLHGKTVTVLCRDKFSEDEKIESVSVETASTYINEPSLHKDVFKISMGDGTATILNNTDKDVNNLIVYYKQTDENGYFGGITYRKLIGTLEAGKMYQIPSEHIDEVVNINYND